MEWITSPDDFARERSRLGRVITSQRLPQQIFPRRPKSIRFLEWDVLTGREFMAGALDIVRSSNSPHFFLAVLSPDPEGYFYRHFSRYPWLRIEGTDSPDQILAALLEDPGGSPADCVIARGDVLVVYDDALDWVVEGDRDLELAVLATFDVEVTQKWENRLSDRLFPLEEAVSSPVFIDVPGPIEKTIRENYG